MSLLEQSSLWLVPYVLMMLVMLFAMMEFTVSLLVKQPQAKRKPIPANELRQRLLAESKDAGSYRLVEGVDCDLEIVWESGELPRSRRMVFSKGASRNHIRLLLDEHRHDLRMNQVSRSYSFFLGLVGWLPRLGGYASAQSGPPGGLMTEEISRVANHYGWNVRPVLWWFQATHRGYRFLERLTPPPLRRWPSRRLWGLLYPLSYFIGVGYLVLIAGGLDWHNWLLLVGVSAGWWGIWGLLVWAMLGFPTFWRSWRR